MGVRRPSAQQRLRAYGMVRVLWAGHRLPTRRGAVRRCSDAVIDGVGAVTTAAVWSSGGVPQRRSSPRDCGFRLRRSHRVHRQRLDRIAQPTRRRGRTCPPLLILVDENGPETRSQAHKLSCHRRHGSRCRVVLAGVAPARSRADPFARAPSVAGQGCVSRRRHGCVLSLCGGVGSVVACVLSPVRSVGGVSGVGDGVAGDRGQLVVGFGFGP